MGIAAAREGLAAVCATISGLHAYEVWPATPVVPAAIVVLTDWQYGPTFDGGLDATFLIVLLVQIGNVEQAQHVADEYLEATGSKSIAAAIRADPGLSAGSSARVQVADVIGGTRYAPQDVGDVPFILPAIEVQVKC